MDDRKIRLGVILMITLGTMIATSSVTSILHPQQAYAFSQFAATQSLHSAPVAISGDNIYVAWWSNKTGNEEVLFRASTDKGQTFGDKINLSNTTDADSTRVEIDSDANNVVVTWWETNETSDVPVMKVSDDNGKTFGPLLKLGANGTIGD